MDKDDGMHATEENQIIADILRGEAEAYAVLVTRYQKPIYNLMLRMNGHRREDAADLTQETFVRAYEKLDDFHTGKRFFPWLYTIALNLARDDRRRRGLAQRAREFLKPPPGAGAPGAEEERQIRSLEARRAQEALLTLPLEYREALVLRYHEGRPLAEIAAAFDISLSAAKMRVHRGLHKLRRLLTAAPGDREEREDR